MPARIRIQIENNKIELATKQNQIIAISTTCQKRAKHAAWVSIDICDVCITPGRPDMFHKSNYLFANDFKCFYDEIAPHMVKSATTTT